MLPSNDTLAESDLAILSMTPWEIARFQNRIDRTPGHGPEGKCWAWVLGKNKGGYGIIMIRGDRPKPVRVLAHRVAFFLETGHLPPPETPCVCHSCDWPPCVRGDHLWAGTRGENMSDMWSKGRANLSRRKRTRPAECSKRGERHECAKLTDAKVLEIRARHSAGERTNGLAREYGVSPVTISDITARRTWHHI